MDDREAAPITQKPGFLEWLDHPLGSGHAHPTIGTHSFPTHPWGISHVTIKHRPLIAMAGRPASKAAVSKARTPLPLPTVCKVVPGRPVSKAFVSKASSRSLVAAAVSKASSRTPLPVATSEEGVEEVQPHQRLDCLYQRLDRLREMQRHRQEKMEQMRKEDEERRGRDRSRTPSRAAASGVEHQLQQVVWIIEVSAKYLRHQAYHRRAAGPAQSMQKFEDLKLNFPWLSTDWKFVACKL